LSPAIPLSSDLLNISIPVTTVFSVLQTYDLYFFVNIDNSTLDTSGYNGSATFDREDVFDRHEERLVGLANWFRDLAVKSGDTRSRIGFASAESIGRVRLKRLES
jgi:hypothetical protein